MKILIDMNLSPAWVSAIEDAGVEAVHWSTIGAPSAPDREIMAWAKAKGHVVLTHDLDFGAILASTGADAPSVVQLRAQDITPGYCAPFVMPALVRFSPQLASGALLSVDARRARVRLLPLRGDEAQPR